MADIDTHALERETEFGWGWFTVLGAVLIVRLLGVALAADLTFQGATALAFGLALEANARAISSSPMEP